MKSQEPVYSIKAISKLFDLPASTLRYYEAEGLLTDVKKNASGQRIYEQKHVNRLKTICCFKHTGMTIETLKRLFALDEDKTKNIDEIVALIQAQKESILAQIDQLKADLDHVQRKLSYYQDCQTAIKAKAPLPEWKNYKA